MFIKGLLGILLILIGLLQYRLWFGDGRLEKAEQYTQQLDILKKQLVIKHRRNEKLAAEVKDLRKGKDAIEEIARYNLGLIKEDEAFFQIIEQ